METKDLREDNKEKPVKIDYIEVAKRLGTDPDNVIEMMTGIKPLGDGFKYFEGKEMKPRHGVDKLRNIPDVNSESMMLIDDSQANIDSWTSSRFRHGVDKMPSILSMGPSDSFLIDDSSSVINAWENSGPKHGVDKLTGDEVDIKGFKEIPKDQLAELGEAIQEEEYGQSYSADSFFDKSISHKHNDITFDREPSRIHESILFGSDKDRLEDARRKAEMIQKHMESKQHILDDDSISSYIGVNLDEGSEHKL